MNAIGYLIVLGCVFGSYLIAGGNMEPILHALPHEMMAIGGAALGAFVVANSMAVVKSTPKSMGRAFKGPRWKKDDYRDVLCLLYSLLDMLKGGGMRQLEEQIEQPETSPVFGRYPRLMADHHVIDFVRDYLRLFLMNMTDPHQAEDAMDADIERHHGEELTGQKAIVQLAEGLPAIGIVAAVLGVIKTMASIDQPTEVLGAMIGGALTGTFLGVLLSYCFIAPIGGRLEQVIDEDGKIYNVIKKTLVAHLHGHSPAVAVEMARRAVPADVQPTFAELEGAIQELPKGPAALAKAA
ncbi:MAG: flagellar motor stator protein MotA [Alphaproteobacteria bacterium]|nr:flagellar motor stator protein MotA [Alphaproteobacteria bacterium]